ncbi:MAG: hypothetical protein V3T05_13575, partial [Myxococcota bacterium]
DYTDDKSAAFDTLFATNHKFYGAMDRFTNVPVDTKNGGLVDIAIKNKTRIGSGTLEVAVHEFILAKRDTVGRKGLIGLEVDVVYTVPLHERVKLIAGAGGFMDQGEFKEERDAARLHLNACANNAAECTGARTFHDWLFLMLDVNL